MDHTLYKSMGVELQFLLMKFDTVSRQLYNITGKLQSMEDNLKSMENNLKSMEDKMQQSEIKMLQKVEDMIQEHRSRPEKSEKEMFALLQKLENQLAVNLRKVPDNLQVDRSSQYKNNKKIFAAIKQLGRQIAFNISEVHNRNQEKVQTALHKLDQDVDNVHNITRQVMNTLPQLQQLNAIMLNQCYVTPTEKSASTTTTTTPKPMQPPFSSCKDVPSKVSGTYLIRVNNDSEPFKVYCEQKSFGGGWIVFQYRFDGSLDFYRGWNEFRDGFGDLNKEFWLGLEKVHQITRGRKHELIVELKDFNGTYKYARYDAFEIGSKSDQYDLKDLGNHSGTAGDAMSAFKGMKFSSKDRDNDVSTFHCAKDFEGAWWYKGCTRANLNGRYINEIDYRSMSWYFFKTNWQGLSYSRMMIRELE
ncbi:angiopoietin-1-like [Anopheles darlingi]|uniref:angiopoietin-1-like n=1 Tax=Anopheles darlingi TaxID=43151 RepID=UPI0021005C19|nr:angiopoietin-1-like [Anopheles darlingi]